MCRGEKEDAGRCVENGGLEKQGKADHFPSRGIDEAQGQGRERKKGGGPTCASTYIPPTFPLSMTLQIDWEDAKTPIFPHCFETQ